MNTISTLKIFEDNQKDPILNIEREKVLHQSLDDGDSLLRFWSSDKSIIMGRFQRAEYEIENDFVKQNNIQILRRHTGGGTVFHDLGVLNITFIKKVKPALKKGQKDADICTELICKALNEIVDTFYKTDRNAIFTHDNLKVLGSAASLTSGFSLFHASLLIDADLDLLNRSIQQNPKYIENDKAFVKSHRSTVVNLSQINKDKLARTRCINQIIEEFSNYLNLEAIPLTNLP